MITGKHLEKKILEKNNGNLDLTVRLGNDQEIKQVSCQKPLGVTLDKGLTCEDHIDNLCKQLQSDWDYLCISAHTLKKGQRELYYDAVIKPKLMHVVWDCCSGESYYKVI